MVCDSTHDFATVHVTLTLLEKANIAGIVIDKVHVCVI